MKTIELKNCPFCSSPVRWCGENEPDPEDNHVCHHIACTNSDCGADFDFQLPSSTDEEFEEDLSLEDHFLNLRMECAARYNRRTNESSD